MGGLISNIFLPIKAGYIKLFEINKYFAVFVLSSSTTLFLFVLMVALISLGDSGLKEDKSVKLADIVMPEREIDTFMDDVDKPEEPEEQPEDIAQPELDLQPTQGIDVSIPKPKASLQLVEVSLEMVNISLFLRFNRNIQEEHKSCLLYTSPSPRDLAVSRMPSSA